MKHFSECIQHSMEESDAYKLATGTHSIDYQPMKTSLVNTLNQNDFADQSV